MLMLCSLSPRLSLCLAKVLSFSLVYTLHLAQSSLIFVMWCSLSSSPKQENCFESHTFFLVTAECHSLQCVEEWRETKPCFCPEMCTGETALQFPMAFAVWNRWKFFSSSLKHLPLLSLIPKAKDDCVFSTW